MNCKAISIDLAKNVFQILGVNERNTPLFNQKIQRKKFLSFMVRFSATTIYMEACYSSSYWARQLQALGHTVKLIPAQHVTPFVRGNKNDANDTIAIFEASQRPYIRFVPIKTEYQQEISCLHRIRERLIKTKTAVCNQTRGLLSEFGVIFNTGQSEFIQGMNSFLDSDQHRHGLKVMMKAQFEEYNALRERISIIDKELTRFVCDSPSGKILMSIPGVGPIIASAILAAIDKGQAFKNPRDFAVWLGLTPQQYASGNTSKMGGITKRGDRYLRKQLIHGARSVVNNTQDKVDQLNVWVRQLRERKSYNQTAVATAHRMARLIWVLLQRQELYVPQPAICGVRHA